MSQPAGKMLVRYAKRPKVPLGMACEGCSIRPATGADHCHRHGWVRGLICPGCNRLMSFIDRRVTPKAEAGVIAALLVLQHRCPGCERLTVSDLEPDAPRIPPSATAVRRHRTEVLDLGDLLPHLNIYAEKRGITRTQAIRHLVAEGLLLNGRPVDVEACDG